MSKSEGVLRSTPAGEKSNNTGDERRKSSSADRRRRNGGAAPRRGTSAFLDEEAPEDEAYRGEGDEEEENEEEEEDEAAVAEEMAGFLAEDHEVEEDGGEEEEEVEEEEDEDKLDEEDLELIAENEREQQREAAGKQHHKLKRLKRFRDSDESSEEGGGARTERLTEADLFADEEVGAAGEYVGEAEDWVEEEPEYRGASGLTAMQQHQLRQIFGPDLTTLMQILKGQRPSRGPGRGERGAGEEAGEAEEGGTAAVSEGAQLISPPSAEALEPPIDEPERLHERYKHRPTVIADTQLQEEATWILNRLREEVTTFPKPFSRIPTANSRSPSGSDATDAEKALHSEIELVPDFPLCLLFDEEAQRKRYDETFKNSGYAQIGTNEAPPEHPGEFFFPRTRSLDSVLADRIQCVLDLLLNERYEVPFIITHRSHMLIPPLTIEAIWWIYDLDVLFWRKKEFIRTLALDANQRIGIPSTIINRIHLETSDETLNDIKQYISSLPAAIKEPSLATGMANGNEPSAMTDIPGATVAGPSGNGDDAMNGGDQGAPSPARPENVFDQFTGANQEQFRRVQRKPKKRQRVVAKMEGLLHKYFLESGLASSWALHVMPTEELVSALKEKDDDWLQHGDADMDMDIEDTDFATGGAFTHSSSSAGGNPSAPPPPAPIAAAGNEAGEAAMTCWLQGIATKYDFANAQQLREGIVKFEGRRIGVDPYFRGRIRSWLSDKVAVTTVTTSAGERQIDPGDRGAWIASRLMRVPVQELLTAPPTPLTEEEYQQVASQVSPYQRWRAHVAAETEAYRFRELGLEIAKGERKGLLTVVIHPVSPSEVVPWRTAYTVDEARWKVARNKLKYLTQMKLSAGGGTSGPNGTGGRLLLEGGDGSDEPYVRELKVLEGIDREDAAMLNGLVQKLSSCFCPLMCPIVWKQLLVDILMYAVTREVLPAVRREVQQKIYRTSEDHVLRRCAAALLVKLGHRPPEHSDWAQMTRDQHDMVLHTVQVPMVFPQAPSWPDFQAMIRESARDPLGDVLDDDQQVKDPAEMERLNEHDAMLRFFPTVTAFVIEKDGTSTSGGLVGPVPLMHMVSVNNQGTLIDAQNFPCFMAGLLGRQMDDLESKAATDECNQVSNFLYNRKTRPNICVVLANCTEANSLFQFLHAKIKADLVNPQLQFEVVWGSPEIPRLFAQSDLCSQPGYEILGGNIFAAQGLSSARCVQNTLGEYCQLWSCSDAEVALSLRLHPLQSELSREAFQQALLNVVVRLVNDVGLYINRLRVCKHLRPMLQFLCGFGPKREAAFYRHFTAPIGSREGIKSHILMGADEPVSGYAMVGERVFANASSFVRIAAGEEFCLDREPADVDPLDDTRIHVQESGPEANQMCKEAISDEYEAGGPLPEDYVREVFRKPQKLEELDLEAYAFILYEGGNYRMLPRLEFIKREIEAPFLDPRAPFDAMAPEVLFFYLQNEDPEALASGCKVNIKFVAQRLPEEDGSTRLVRYWVTEPTGIRAMLIDQNRVMNLRAAGTGVRVTTDLIPENTLIKVRIDHVDFQTQRLVCYCDPRSVTQILSKNIPMPKWPMSLLSPLVDYDLSNAAEMFKKRVETLAQNLPQKRRINHPLFRAVSHMKMVEILRSTPQFAAFFRASESRQHLLYVHFVTVQQPFRFKALPMQESGPVDSTGVGSELLLAGERFQALDEVISRFCSPFHTFLKDVLDHEKYRVGISAGELKSQLTELAQRNFSSIQWGLTLDQSVQPHEPYERFDLIAVTCATRTGTPKATSDRLYVSHRGCRLWGRQFNSLTKLLAWWKSEGYNNRRRYIEEYERQKHDRN